MSFRILVLIIANEGISILENLSEMGVPIHRFLKKVFERLDNKKDEGPD